MGSDRDGASARQAAARRDVRMSGALKRRLRLNVPRETWACFF